MERQNAIIESTQLGNSDHGGVMDCWLFLKYDGGGQGFGGYCLDEPRFEKGVEPRKFIGRFGTAWGMEYIKRVLQTVGVDRWENLPGQHVRVECEQSKIHRIGHIIEDRWFDPENDLKEFLK